MCATDDEFKVDRILYRLSHAATAGELGMALNSRIRKNF